MLLTCRPWRTRILPYLLRGRVCTFSTSSFSSEQRKIRPSQIAYHWETTPATEANLAEAKGFFKAHPPSSLFVAGKLHQVKFTSVPEVAFFGRSNVGKSSLLNAIMGTPLCRTSGNPGRTRTMNAYAVGGPDSAANPGRINILDMPGYGKGSREEWGKQIEKYLAQRKELKRVFFMIDSLHGLKESDKQFMQLLRHKSIPHQLIMSKVDRVIFGKSKNSAAIERSLDANLKHLAALFEQLKKDAQPKKDGPPALGEILACSTDLGRWKHYSTEASGRMGINGIRWAIMKATGMATAGNKGTSQIEVI